MLFRSLKAFIIISDIKLNFDSGLSLWKYLWAFRDERGLKTSSRKSEFFKFSCWKLEFSWMRNFWGIWRKPLLRLSLTRLRRRDDISWTHWWVIWTYLCKILSKSAFALSLVASSFSGWSFRFASKSSAILGTIKVCTRLEKMNISSKIYNNRSVPSAACPIPT